MFKRKKRPKTDLGNNYKSYNQQIYDWIMENWPDLIRLSILLLGGIILLLLLLYGLHTESGEFYNHLLN